MLARLSSLPLVFALTGVSFVAACGGDDKSDADYQKEITVAMHDSIATELQTLADAAVELQAAAPAHAWDATTDAAAITVMKTAWKKARVAYEHVEGATAPIFPDFDVSTDERYDGFLGDLGATGDQDLFDDQGVTGAHAIERVLFAPEIRPEVIAFESTLPGYKAAAWPASDAEASTIKSGLLQKFVDDTQALHDQWAAATEYDLGGAFQGLIGLMNEQKEKVNLAATGEEESRYANVTLFDLHNNLAGTEAIYTLFQEWIQAKGATEQDDQIATGFTQLNTLYSAVSGDKLPAVPDTWSSDNPSATDLATPFGVMWQGVHDAVDPTASGSVVFEMNEVAIKLGFPEFVEE